MGIWLGFGGKKKRVGSAVWSCQPGKKEEGRQSDHFLRKGTKEDSGKKPPIQLTTLAERNLGRSGTIKDTSSYAQEEREGGGERSGRSILSPAARRK